MLEVFTDLNERQQEAVRQVNGSLLVIAPVGTGKTKILTHRAANAINSGIKPSDILCLSFTNRAAREMKERVLSFLGKSAGDMTVCTFHGLCTHIIRNEADFLGIDSDFTIYDEEDAKTVLGRLWRKQGIAVSRTDMERFGAFLFNFIQDVKLEPYMRTIPRNMDIVFRDLLHSSYLKELDKKQLFGQEEIFEEYNTELSENHVLDFADLIVDVIELFDENPDILSKWQSIYEWIQVDEIQDTNLSEYRVISSLAREHRNLSFFGDIDQTIYEWRGSEPNKIKGQFLREFAPVKEIPLVRNYRSTKTIVEACRAVNKKRPNAVTADIETVESEVGERIYIHSAQTIAYESDWIVTQIQEMKQRYSTKYRDICVLTRRNITLETISRRLGEADIPHFMIEQLRFFRRTEIKDAIAYLRLLVNKYDTNSLLRILDRPPRGIGSATVERMRGIPRKTGLKLVDFLEPATFQYHDPYGLLFEKLAQGKVVVFDVESTGMDVLRDEIIEIAAVKLDKSGTIGRFHELVKNSRPVGASFDVHNISDDELQINGKDPVFVFGQFLDFIDDCILVGHNIYYDISILRSQLRRIGLDDSPVGDFYDTLEMTKRIMNFPKYSLSHICETLGISIKPTHRANADAEATAELLKRLVPKIQDGRHDREGYVAQFARQFQPLAQQFQKWRKNAEITHPRLLLEKILRESGYLDYILQQEGGIRRIENLNELLSICQKYTDDDNDRSPLESLINVIDIASLGNEIDRFTKGKDDDKVLLLTVHQVKGLEFDTVFIAGATDNEFPSWRSQQEGDSDKRKRQLDEEHRLFYVGMTRAKKRLILSYHNQNDYGYSQSPSRYIGMIPRNLVATGNRQRIAEQSKTSSSSVGNRVENTSQDSDGPVHKLGKVIGRIAKRVANRSTKDV